MNLLRQFKDHISSQHLYTTKDKLLLAVSGGLDSIVLCELCRQAGYDFRIAHCNFSLRGEESKRDQQFVQQLAAAYAVPFLLEEFDTEQYAATQKLSIQEAARALRYNWFDRLVNEWKEETVTKENGSAVYLLTAHHADDNNETLLMHFFRGTGLHGLTGIPARSGYIRRPMLPFTKNELLAFANEYGLKWVEDSSNESSKYTRNFFRNEILPAISRVYPQVQDNLKDNIGRFIETEKLYRLAVDGIKKKLCRHKGAELHIPVKQLMKFNNRALIYDIIEEYGFGERQVEEVIKLAASESGRYILSPAKNFRLIRHRHWFIISPQHSAEGSDNIIIEKDDREVVFPGGTIIVKETASATPVADQLFACFSPEEIHFPLLLRRWKAGDYFYPLGMKKKKKVARFLIDQKLTKPQKENTWVLESNKRIVWVAGHRIDDRVKIKANTKKGLLLQFIPFQT